MSWLMKGLSVAGTLAMFLVGGGILTHGIGRLHHLVDRRLGGAGAVLAALAPLLIDLAAGVIAGTLVLMVVTAFKRLHGAPAAAWRLGGRGDCYDSRIYSAACSGPMGCRACEAGCPSGQRRERGRLPDAGADTGLNVG